MSSPPNSVFSQDTECLPGPASPQATPTSQVWDAESETQLIESAVIACSDDFTPKKNELTRSQPSRSSPRLRKQRSNSCNREDDSNRADGKLKRGRSADQQTRAKISDDDLAAIKNKLRCLRTPSPTPEDAKPNTEDVNSMNSQCIKLRFSPSSPSPVVDDLIGPPRKRNMTESEPSTVYKNSDRLDFGPVSRSNSADFKFSNHMDHDSTGSVDMDSPINLNVPPLPLTKNKDYITQYSSSTPESAPLSQSMILKTMKQHGITISDSEGDSTPPIFSNQKHSNSNKLNMSTSPSPLVNSSTLNGTNGTVPTFSIQMYCDENNEFLSLFVVRTNSDIGSDMCKEYQRLSRRLTMDPYAGDVSKSSSPSSVTSTGMLQLPAKARTSALSSVSSTSISSSRTSDGNFVIPQRPFKKLNHQDPIQVKGVNGLKNKLNDILVHLSDTYGGELSYHNDDKDHSHEIHQISNGGHENSNGNGSCNGTTPRSSKKKMQLKGKRTQLKMRKNILPETVEESNDTAMSLHSPEMISSDIFKPKESRVLPDMTSSPKTPKARTITCSPPPMLTGDYVDYSIGTLVLAKWADKRYYSGRVKQVLNDGKYSIEFDDGRVKTLLSEFIIFGTLAELPIVGQSVYAMIDKDQNYEPGLILGLEETESGEVKYKCTTDRHSMILVEPNALYLTEDQAKSIKENAKSTCSTPSTPRRRGNDLDLNNILPKSPRSARFRDRNNSLKISFPSSPKASTSRGTSAKRATPIPKKRHESESSEGGDAASIASSTAFEEVVGIQPEIQKTPRKLVGAPAHPLLIKGMSKHAVGKKSSKVCKFDLDENSLALYGPIPPKGSTIFEGLCFLLTCTEMPPIKDSGKDTSNVSDSASDKEGLSFTRIPFCQERLKEQLECGGGIVYRDFEDIPRDKYKVCKLIAPGPCLSAKYIQCLSSNIRAYRHYWVIKCCSKNKRIDFNEEALPTGWSVEKNMHIEWKTTSARTNNSIFKNKLILFCSELPNTAKFWDRVCMMAGANTKIITDIDFDLSGSHAIVTDNECPHEIQNRAVLENIPLVSTTWVVQCLIEGRVCDPKNHIKYNFRYIEAD